MIVARQWHRRRLKKQTKKQHKRSIFAAVYAVNQGYDPEDLL
jgi:hypothetical protein